MPNPDQPCPLTLRPTRSAASQGPTRHKAAGPRQAETTSQIRLQLLVANPTRTTRVITGGSCQRTTDSAADGDTPSHLAPSASPPGAAARNTPTRRRLVRYLPRTSRIAPVASGSLWFLGPACPAGRSTSVRRLVRYSGWLDRRLGHGGAVAAGGGAGAGEAAGGGGADQAPDPARGALGLRLLHAPEGLPQLRPRHPAAPTPTPQCRK